MKKLLCLFVICLALGAMSAGCSRDIEVERTRLPHVDKPAE
jgi:hypothetical protein